MYYYKAKYYSKPISEGKFMKVADHNSWNFFSGVYEYSYAYYAYEKMSDIDSSDIENGKLIPMTDEEIAEFFEDLEVEKTIRL